LSDRSDADSLPLGKEGDAWLAGGTWLFSERSAFGRLIDLTTLGWPGHRVGRAQPANAATHIAKLQEISLPVGWTAAPLIASVWPRLRGIVQDLEHRHFGGNICMSLPAGPMIPLACGLDGVATIWTRDGGERRSDHSISSSGGRKTF